MDVVKKLNENVLSCSICTEKFKDPSTLGCGHTFCTGCLVKFIKTQQEAIRAQSIPCPICRQMTKVPNPIKPPEEWPTQFKPHFLIQGLLDELTASDDTLQVAAAATGVLCSPCQQIGKTVQAGCLCQDCDVTLCEDCVKRHKTIPATSHHVVSGDNGEVKVKGRRKVICKEHNCVVEFCCKKCNKAICLKCSTIYHRKCGSIVTIDSMISDMKSAMQEAKQNVMRSVEDLETNLGVQKSELETAGQNKALIQSDIRKVSQQAMDLVKQKEKQLVEELDELTEKQTGQLRGQIKSGETDLQMYQQYSEFIDQALRSESPMDLYDMYQMCQSGVVSSAVSKRIDVSGRWSSNNIKFVDKLKPQTFEREFELGRLVVPKSGIALTNMPTLHNTINMWTGGCREEIPYPRDLTIMEADGEETMVVTNYNNNCVKTFSAGCNPKHKKTLRLRNKPNTISKLTHNQVVISCPYRNEFIIVQTSPDLTLLSTIRTKKDYKCLLALNQKHLVAGYWEPGGIDVIDVSGKVLRPLITSGTGKRLIMLVQRPCYMSTTNKGHILVSDCGSKSVYCFTQKGDVVFLYKSSCMKMLEAPRGIASAPSGDIFVMDSEHSKVVHLTESVFFVEDLLTSVAGIESPCGVCLHGNRLYICQYWRGTVDEYHF